MLLTFLSLDANPFVQNIYSAASAPTPESTLSLIVKRGNQGDFTSGAKYYDPTDEQAMIDILEKGLSKNTRITTNEGVIEQRHDLKIDHVEQSDTKVDINYMKVMNAEKEVAMRYYSERELEIIGSRVNPLFREYTTDKIYHSTDGRRFVIIPRTDIRDENKAYWFIVCELNAEGGISKMTLHDAPGSLVKVIS